MADGATGDQLQCGFCGTPIVRREMLVQVNGIIYCCPNCELAAERGDLARRARRGGGYVLACHLCHTPIFVPEIMIIQGQRNYCCVNCAEVAQRRLAATLTTPPIKHG